eukprot:2985197-Amphidinium_carterae.1
MQLWDSKRHILNTSHATTQKTQQRAQAVGKFKPDGVRCPPEGMTLRIWRVSAHLASRLQQFQRAPPFLQRKLLLQTLDSLQGIKDNKDCDKMPQGLCHRASANHCFHNNESARVTTKKQWSATVHTSQRRE